jgi:hypothetical protein
MEGAAMVEVARVVVAREEVAMEGRVRVRVRVRVSVRVRVRVSTTS